MAAHRYWRFYVSGTATGYVGFSEIELRSSNGGSDLTGSGTASASSEFSGSYVAGNAVDDNSGTQWTASSTVPQWWRYDFGSGIAYDIVQFVITPRTDGAYTQAPSTYTFDYSDDGSSWTTAASYSGVSWPDATAKTFDVFTLPVGAYVSHFVVEVLAEVYDSAAIAADSFSLSDAAAVSLGSTGPPPATIEISDAFSNWDDKTKVQRRNAPNVPIDIFDTFSDSYELVGEFSLQIDAMQGAQFNWGISDAIQLSDAIYASEINSLGLADALDLNDGLEFIVPISVEVQDSYANVWEDEDGPTDVGAIMIEMVINVGDALDLSDGLEISETAVGISIDTSDAISLSDGVAVSVVLGRAVGDNFVLSDSIRALFVRSAEVADLLSLSDAVGIGWDWGVSVADAISFDDTGGAGAFIPSHIEIEIGVDLLRIAFTEGLSLSDGDFSNQGLEVYKGGTNISYLRRYLNDVPR